MRTENPRDLSVTVVGAGFSGLVSAFYLVRSGYKVRVLEASSKAGGLISTVETPQGLVETAANGLLNSAAVEELFREIDLEIMPTLKESRKRYIFRNGRPRRWPLSLVATLRLIWFVLRYLLARKSVSPNTNENVRDWATRVMGAEVSAYTVEAALQGIYAGNPTKMSASVIFGRFFASRGAKASATKPRHRGTVTAPRGMGQLIEKLKSYLEARGVEFSFDSPQRFERTPDTPVVLATSAHAAAEALTSISPVRSALLRRVELLPIVTSTVFFRDTDPKSQGFGCLFPPTERRRVLGVLKNNFIFENRVIEGFSENWILGGVSAQLSHAASLSDQEILKLIVEERRACFRGQNAPFASVITRWPQALPHYTVELEKLLPQLQGVENNVLLIGNYLGQIGLAKILERAAKVPQEIAAHGTWRAL